MEFDKKEIRDIAIVALIAAFVFSFNEWGTSRFDAAEGMKNLFTAFIFCSIIYLSHASAQKLVASHYQYRIGFTLISMQRRINELKKFITIPIGPIITVLATLVSNGKFIFILLSSYKYIPENEYRVGKHWIHIKEYEEAQVALAGPLSQILLLIIFKLLLPVSIIFNKAMFIVSIIAIYNMLPLPHVDGMKIFFGSRPLYIASLIFIIAFIILIFHLSIIQTIILALLFTTVLSTIYLYKKLS